MNYTEAFLLLSKLDKDAQDRILQKTTFVIKNNENYIKMLLELILKNTGSNIKNLLLLSSIFEINKLDLGEIIEGKEDFQY